MSLTPATRDSEWGMRRSTAHNRIARELRHNPDGTVNTIYDGDIEDRDVPLSDFWHLSTELPPQFQNYMSDLDKDRTPSKQKQAWWDSQHPQDLQRWQEIHYAPSSDDENPYITDSSDEEIEGVKIHTITNEEQQKAQEKAEARAREGARYNPLEVTLMRYQNVMYELTGPKGNRDVWDRDHYPLGPIGKWDGRDIRWIRPAWIQGGIRDRKVLPEWRHSIRYKAETRQDIAGMSNKTIQADNFYHPFGGGEMGSNYTGFMIPGSSTVIWKEKYQGKHVGGTEQDWRGRDIRHRTMVEGSLKRVKGSYANMGGWSSATAMSLRRGPNVPVPPEDYPAPPEDETEHDMWWRLHGRFGGVPYVPEEPPEEVKDEPPEEDEPPQMTRYEETFQPGTYTKKPEHFADFFAKQQEKGYDEDDRGVRTLTMSDELALEMAVKHAQEYPEIKGFNYSKKTKRALFFFNLGSPTSGDKFQWETAQEFPKKSKLKISILYVKGS